MTQLTIDEIALVIYPTMIERYYKVTDKLTLKQKAAQNLTAKSPAIWAKAFAENLADELNFRGENA